MFVKAELKNGGAVISEFRKLRKLRRYAGEVFSGQPFTVWKKVSDTHPLSGEKNSVRTRVLINPSEIVSITEVQPKAGQETTHDLNPNNFEPAVTIARGGTGLWKAPKDGSVEGAVPGATYPKHRDTISMRHYVILQAGEGAEEVRYFVDGRGDGVLTSAGAFGGAWDSNDDEDGDDFSDDDDNF